MYVKGNCTSVINLTYRGGSEGSLTNPVKYNNQDYKQLKDSCLRSGNLFVDSTFPPNSQSLGDLPDLSSWREAQVQWLRPKDILKIQQSKDKPVFCTNGASRFDFTQGSVGNCWFLAAISALTFQKNLLVQVVPMKQSFKNYAGIFHFRFWRFGKWVDVVIDDFLPVLDKHLLSVSSKDGNEFWVPLLEKAYAKVCGSYADMNAGLPSEACKDFSGGVNMISELRNAHTVGHDEQLWLSLKRGIECDAMICCGTAWKGDTLVNTVSHTGLVDAHAYSVTGVTEVSYYGSKVRLVRVMNPWGRQEWRGKWSDNSSEWNRVSPEDREKCLKSDDGEFWIELEDFCYYFNNLFICCENPNFMTGDLHCQWKCEVFEGSWVAGKSAGGSLNDYSFEKNPQYFIQVPDDGEQGGKNVLFSLMQKPQRHHRSQTRFYPIGLNIFKVPPGTPKGHLEYKFFSTSRAVKDIQKYFYEREVIEFHSLEPGDYVVIPSTMRPYMSGDFVLTVYSIADAKVSPHDGDGDDHVKEGNNILVLPEVPTDEDEEEEEEEVVVEEEEEEEEEKEPIRVIFDRYAHQGELNARQLQKLLNDKFARGSWFGFYLDTCRSLIALVDVNRNMRMTFLEFSALWKKIGEFKQLFKSSDTNKNGYLNESEFKKAMYAAGMEMNDETVRLMMFRYSDSDTLTNLSFPGFITLMIRMDRMFNVFNDSSSDINLDFDVWSTMFMYN